MTAARKQKQSLYGKDPRLLPNYGIAEAASWLGLPYSTVRAWTLGQKGFEPVVHIADPRERLLSFQNLVELHVLAAMRRLHGVSLQRVRKAVAYLQRRLGAKRPLASTAIFTDGADVIVDVWGSLVNASREGQLEMREVVAAYLDRVEVARDGSALRLYPLSRPQQLDGPKVVVIDPRVQFGRPCVVGTGVPTEEIADRFRAGESIADLAEDFRLEVGDIEEVIRYEQAA